MRFSPKSWCPPAAAHTATYEMRQKEALDWPLAAASVAIKMKGAMVGSARIVLGHVAPTPWEATAAGESLAGKTITADNRRSRRQSRGGRRPAAQPERLQSATGQGGGQAGAAGGGESEGLKMESLPVIGTRCEKLRWKGMFVEAVWKTPRSSKQRPRLLVPAHFQMPGPGRPGSRRRGMRPWPGRASKNCRGYDRPSPLWSVGMGRRPAKFRKTPVTPAVLPPVICRDSHSFAGTWQGRKAPGAKKPYDGCILRHG